MSIDTVASITTMSIRDRIANEKQRRSEITAASISVGTSQIQIQRGNSCGKAVVLPSSVVPFNKMQYIPRPQNTSESNSQFWLRNSRNVQFILMNSVQASSRGTYHTGWKSFCKFAQENQFSPYLQTVPTVYQDQLAIMPQATSFRESAIMAYMTQLFYEERKKPKTISNYCTGIRFVFKVNGLDISIFSSVRIASYRTALNLIHRVDNPIADDLKLPFTCDMILYAIKHSYNTSSIEHSAIRTALVLSFSCLLRVSEYLGVYAVRCGDIVFTVLLHNGNTISLPAEKVYVNRSRIVRVVDVNIIVRYSKTDQFGFGHRYFFKAGSSHEDSFDLVQILFDHASLLINSQPSTPFFHSIGPTKFKLTYDMFTISIRVIAAAFNLPIKRFKTHSLRIGGACALLAANVSEAIVKLMGRWKSLAFLYYLRMMESAYNTAISAISNPKSMTVEHIRRLVRDSPANVDVEDSAAEDLDDGANDADDEDAASLHSELGFT